MQPKKPLTYDRAGNTMLEIKRKMTFNERLYQLGERIFQPFALQYIIEGSGTLDIERLKATLSQLTTLLPALKLQLKGKIWTSDGKPPTLFIHSEVFSSDWNDPLFHSRLQAEKGHCSEFHWFELPQPTLIFRVLHSVMDAKGIQRVLSSLFALLRGEEFSSDKHFQSDMLVRRQLAGSKGLSREGYSLQWPGFPLPQNSPTSYHTKLIRLNRQPEASLAKWAAAYVTELGKEARLMIPVDLRRYPEVTDSVSNLSLPIYLHVKPNQAWQEIQASLLLALSRNEELAQERLERLGLLVPEYLLRWIILKATKIGAEANKFPMSGILSDNGFIDLADFSTQDFQAKSIISLPVYVPLAPCCMTALHHSSGTNVTISVPAGTDLSPVINRFLTTLQEEAPITTNVDSTLLIDEFFSKIRSIWAKELGCSEDIISPDIYFHALGGDSMKLLNMLSNVAFSYIEGPPNHFFDEALKTGGHLSIRMLSDLIKQFQ